MRISDWSSDVCSSDLPKARDAKRAETLEAEILADFADIKSIDEDRILRLFHAVIGATLRTHAFAPAAEEALAFKLDSAQIPGLPKPLPWREVWVYSPRVEATHLRSDERRVGKECVRTCKFRWS